MKNMTSQRMRWLVGGSLGIVLLVGATLAVA
ncbi:MAG: hypothetical protein RL328_2482, partial [Acidobacteriota bacterium]